MDELFSRLSTRLSGSPMTLTLRTRLFRFSASLYSVALMLCVHAILDFTFYFELCKRLRLEVTADHGNIHESCAVFCNLC